MLHMDLKVKKNKKFKINLKGYLFMTSYKTSIIDANHLVEGLERDDKLTLLTLAFGQFD